MNFGKSQLYTSSRFKKTPKLGRLIFAIFGYTSVGNYARSKVFLKLMERLPYSTFNKIMDLGAGLGEYSFMLSENLPESKITAVEILEERVEILKETIGNQSQYSNVAVFPDKIDRLDENNSFDFIFSVDVFEHIKMEEMPFSECFNKLKPGGYLLIKMPNIVQSTILPESWFEDHNEWLEHEHVGQVYNLEDLKDRFKSEGFEIQYACYTDGILSRIGWELGYFGKKLGSVMHLLLLPLCKLFILLDNLSFSRKKGNSIQVIGTKPA